MKSDLVQKLWFIFIKLTDSRFKKTIFSSIILALIFGTRKALSSYKIKTNLINDDNTLTV